MFKPKYKITNQLLENIKKVNNLVNELNNKRLPSVVLVEFEKTALAVSVYASTSIEGNPLPLTEVKKILKSKPAYVRDSEKEVLNYNKALVDLSKKINQKKTKLTLGLILIIQKTVVEELLPKYELGKLRQRPVVVNDPRTGQIIYLPPDVKDVKFLLNDLIVFVSKNKEKIDPLILAGIFHKQMVIIHPFMDGNGRVTRLITKMLLAQMGLNTFNLFSFENYYNKNVTKYFQNVGEIGNYYELVDKIDFTLWLEYFTEGIIDELLRIKKQLTETKITPEFKFNPYYEAILKFIQKEGLITDRDYKAITKRARSTRAKDFQKLINLGLIERKGRSKATYYILKEKE